MIGPDAAQAEPLILKAMESKDGSLAVTAATSLTEIQPQSKEAAAKAIAVLTAGLSDPLPETREAAAEALGRMGPMAREAAAALQKTAKDDANKAVRQAAAKALEAVQ